MKELGAGKLVRRKSRFYAYLYHIDHQDELTIILSIHRTKYKKANHHCYAFRCIQNQVLIERCSDDGEVGHPGKILLELLNQHDLENHVLVVSRIFGGIKLGVGGVSKSFRDAGNAVIANMHSK